MDFAHIIDNIYTSDRAGQYDADQLALDMWVLAHNIEVAAALSIVRNLTWAKGFEAHKTLTEFCKDLHDRDAN